MAEQKDPEPDTSARPDLAPVSMPVPAPEVGLADDADASVEVVGVEPEAVQARGLIGVAFVMFLTITVAVIMLFQWTNLEVQEAEREAVSESGYPALRESNAAGVRQLNQYQYDAAGDAYRIPIERAIELEVLDGYRSRDAQSFSPELRLMP